MDDSIDFYVTYFSTDMRVVNKNLMSIKRGLYLKALNTSQNEYTNQLRTWQMIVETKSMDCVYVERERERENNESIR